MKNRLKQLIEDVIKNKVIIKEEEYPVQNSYFPSDLIFTYSDDGVMGLDKETFIKIIQELKQVQEKEDFLEEETGVYTPGLKAHYLEVIFSLFNAIFTQTQVELISYFLYEQKSLKRSKGKITITTGEVKQTVDISDAEKLWEALELFEEK